MSSMWEEVFQVFSVLDSVFQRLGLTAFLKFLRLHQISLENFEYAFNVVLHIVKLLDSSKQCQHILLRRRIQLEKSYT
jgi:hypothetical protein